MGEGKVENQVGVVRNRFFAKRRRFASLAAYDAAKIDETSRQLNHIPIIDKNGRGKEVIPMAPREAERYKGRSVAERANSRLKENFGANNVMVRGATKVTMHLMFGVITLFADLPIRLLG